LAKIENEAKISYIFYNVQAFLLAICCQRFLFEMHIDSDKNVRKIT